MNQKNYCFSAIDEQSNRSKICLSKTNFLAFQMKCTNLRVVFDSSFESWQKVHEIEKLDLQINAPDDILHT